MNRITSFPKIFAIGTNYILDIFKEDVEISEKIDGSQFCFGKVNGELYLRSKGAQLYVDNPEKMFAEGIDYVYQHQSLLPDNFIFYAEYLKNRKHNTLMYGRIPKNHLMLFGVMDLTHTFHTNLEEWADKLDIECVPIIYRGKIESADELAKLLDRESILGEAKIEGVVVKNYTRKFLLGGQPMPLMAGKYVSENFKEVHKERWGTEEKTKGRMQIFFESFRTEARWEKSVQHLRDQGLLLQEPKDIGKLLKSVYEDIDQEEQEEVKEWLWKEFNKELKRVSTLGLPEWYKERLLSRSF